MFETTDKTPTVGQLTAQLYDLSTIRILRPGRNSKSGPTARAIDYYYCFSFFPLLGFTLRERLVIVYNCVCISYTRKNIVINESQFYFSPVSFIRNRFDRIYDFIDDTRVLCVHNYLCKHYKKSRHLKSIIRILIPTGKVEIVQVKLIEMLILDFQRSGIIIFNN